ncbi:MAG TPA: hypothetical protein VHO66_03015 [Ruminiclostridium sp.]|nr:hypothetical protein [Ruminiclostridium sp.]
MSFPNIPNVTASISINRDDALNLILSSIAFEELGLSHIINSEAEKIQYVLGTLEGHTPPRPATIDDLLKINKSVGKMLRYVIEKEMLLEFKLEDVISTTTTTTSTTTTSTTSTSTTTTKEYP